MEQTTRPIKILFISHSSGMVGAERSLLLLLKGIDRKRFEPIVVLPKSGSLENEISNLNITTYEIRSPWWMYGNQNMWRLLFLIPYNLILEIIALFKLYMIIRKEDVDVIYTNTIVQFSGAIIALLLKKPHIWHIREIIPNNPDLKSLLPNKILFSFILKSSKKIICNSNAATEQFYDNKFDDNIKVVYNSVDIGVNEKSFNYLSIHDVKKSDWLVVVVGTLQERKAQDDAIKACKIAKNVIPNIKLLIVGEGNEKYRTYLKELINKLDMSDNVIFTGYRDDVPLILPHCNVLLMPSLNEPFGRVIIEAMAARIPVIGSNSGGIREIIKDGVTGYLVSPKEPSEIAEKIIYIFYHPEEAKDMGNEGNKIAIRKFSNKNYANSIEEIIQQVF